jgi:GTP-binding protein EngB required for normal cell division
VLTKIDKLKRLERRKAMDDALETLGLEAEQILPFSSKTGEGREELLAALEVLLSATDA